jgi:CHAD domain-containing protein
VSTSLGQRKLRAGRERIAVIPQKQGPSCHALGAVAHSIREAADQILTEIKVALEGLNAEDPSSAVHDYRVALKRWRALLRLQL